MSAPVTNFETYQAKKHKTSIILPPAMATLFSLTGKLVTASESKRLAEIEEAGLHEMSRILNLKCVTECKAWLISLIWPMNKHLMELLLCLY